MVLLKKNIFLYIEIFLLKLSTLCTKLRVKNDQDLVKTNQAWFNRFLVEIDGILKSSIEKQILDLTMFRSRILGNKKKQENFDFFDFKNDSWFKKVSIKRIQVTKSFDFSQNNMELKKKFGLKIFINLLNKFSKKKLEKNLLVQNYFCVLVQTDFCSKLSLGQKQ